MNSCVVEKEWASPVSVGFNNCISAGVRKCMVFKYSKDKDIKRSYYGGAFCDADSGTLTLFYDVLRPHLFTEVKLKDIAIVHSSDTSVDMMLKNRSWISGSYIERIQSDLCDCRKKKFCDKRLLSVHNNIAVVNLAALDMTPTDTLNLRENCMMDNNVFFYPNPLTIAYERNNEEIFIGYWDIEEEHFIGNKERYWRSLLDIGI